MKRVKYYLHTQNYLWTILKDADYYFQKILNQYDIIKIYHFIFI